MPKGNTLADLNDLLFEQLQNIVDPEEGTDQEENYKKARAVCMISDKIIKNANTVLTAVKIKREGRETGGDMAGLSKMIGNGSK